MIYLVRSKRLLEVFLTRLLVHGEHFKSLLAFYFYYLWYGQGSKLYLPFSPNSLVHP